MKNEKIILYIYLLIYNLLKIKKKLIKLFIKKYSNWLI